MSRALTGAAVPVSEGDMLSDGERHWLVKYIGGNHADVLRCGKPGDHHPLSKAEMFIKRIDSMDSWEYVWFANRRPVEVA